MSTVTIQFVSEPDTKKEQEALDLQAIGDQDLLDPKRAQSFTELYTKDRRRLYAFIYTIVGDSVAADDIFQESSMVLWREFHKFQEGTNFSKWANAIAFNRIREFWRSRKKQGQLFDENQTELIADRMVDMEPELDHRWEVLSGCMAKLRDVDQDLFKNFYAKQYTAAQLAEKTGRSISEEKCG